MKRILISISMIIGFQYAFSESYLLKCISNIDTIFSDLTKYQHYENELNINIVERNLTNEELFGDDVISYTKKENEYCCVVNIDNVPTKTFAMMQISGSGRFPYLTIYTFDKTSKKYCIFFQSDDKYVIPVDINGTTKFFEKVTNFDNKRVIGYNLLEIKNGYWNSIESVNTTYFYKLNNEEQKWITLEIIEKMANFDYSFLGYTKDHPNEVVSQVKDKEIKGALYYTSVGYMPSNYDIKIIQNNTVIKDFGNQWGFLIKRDGQKNYLVYIGMGEDQGEQRVSTIEDFYLNVIDLDTMQRVYKSFIQSEIKIIEK